MRTIVESDTVLFILNVIAIFIIIHTVVHKLILLDGFVHSVCLKDRMKKRFPCIYGYGVDEYFVLKGFGLFTSILALVFVILNGVDSLYCVSSLWSVAIEIFISCVFVSIYGIQLHKYESAFQGTVIPFLFSCIGILLTASILWKNVITFILFVGFVLWFLVYNRKITSIARTLVWGDHAVVHIEDVILDSEKESFYLLFYSKSDITIFLKERHKIVFTKIDCVEHIERTSKLFDELDARGRQKCVIPLSTKFVAWVTGSYVFRSK